jgi:hypothetical protein
MLNAAVIFAIIIGFLVMVGVFGSNKCSERAREILRVLFKDENKDRKP